MANRLESTISNLMNISENTSASMSRVMDADSRPSRPDSHVPRYCNRRRWRCRPGERDRADGTKAFGISADKETEGWV